MIFSGSTLTDQKKTVVRNFKGVPLKVFHMKYSFSKIPVGGYTQNEGIEGKQAYIIANDMNEAVRMIEDSVPADVRFNFFNIDEMIDSTIEISGISESIKEQLYHAWKPQFETKTRSLSDRFKKALDGGN